MKIKLTENEHELEGIIEKGKVTPFENSAHIPFNKKHMGKIVYVIVPTTVRYVWMISKKEKDRFLKEALKIAELENGKLEFHRKRDINSLKENIFEIEELSRIINLIEKTKEKFDKSVLEIVNKIKVIYTL